MEKIEKQKNSMEIYPVKDYPRAFERAFGKENEIHYTIIYVYSCFSNYQ